MIKLVKKLNKFLSFSQLVELNTEYSLVTKEIKKEVYLSSSFVTRVLDLQKRENILELKRLRIINNIPVSIETSFIRSSFLRNIERFDFNKVPLYSTIAENYDSKITFSNEEILIVKATNEEAANLNIEFGSDLTMIKGISYDQSSNPIEYFESVSLPELYIFQS